MTALADIRAATFAALRPPAKIDLSDWVQTHVRLPSTVAATPGPMRLFPWQVEVARSIGSPLVERVSIIKSARVGATQLMTAALGHFAVNDPAPVLVVMPSESDCRMLADSILDPTFDASPALRGVLREDAAGTNNKLHRHFPGGSLSLISGGSPKNLRARTARVLLIDEVDALESDIAGEGDPIALAIRRTMTFATSRKIIMASTPIDEATSRILRAYGEGDRRVFEVPCPHCGEFHEISWKDIQWPTGKPEAACYVCPHCGGVAEESGKAAMVREARWRATAPEITTHHSYRINTFTSTLPTAAWGILAQEFVAAKNDPHLLKTFVNTVMGEAWRDDSEGMDEAELYDRRESFNLDSIPPEVIALTCGADVQHDRIEMATLGHTRDGSVCVLAHEVLWGDVMRDEVWQAINEALKQSFPHPNGGTLRYDATLIDAGDGMTADRVYSFTMGRAGQRIFPLKGVSGFRAPAVTLGRASNKAVRLQLVGVDGIKQRLLGMTERGLIRFSDTLGADWFEQFTSERLQIRYSKGVPTREWHRLAGRRAEAWDCVVYGVAARHLAAIDPDRRDAELSSRAAPVKMPTVVKSAWLNRPT